MLYAGMTPLSCVPSCALDGVGTGEYSNVEATNVTGSTILNQTFFGGSFLLSSQGGGAGGGSTSGGRDAAGIPKISGATLDASSAGQSAWVQGNFGEKFWGTIAVCGTTTGSGKNSVGVKLSNDNFSTYSPTIYSELWNSSTLGDLPTCKPLVSANGYQYVRLVSNYSSGTGGLTLQIGAISFEIGSFAQGQSHASTGGGGVTYYNNILQANDSLSTVLTTTGVGTATISADFGVLYGGRVVFDATCPTSPCTVEISGSKTGAGGSYTAIEQVAVLSGALQWQNDDNATFNDYRYIAFTLEGSASHDFTLDIDAVYVA